MSLHRAFIAFPVCLTLLTPACVLDRGALSNCDDPGECPSVEPEDVPDALNPMSRPKSDAATNSTVATEDGGTAVPTNDAALNVVGAKPEADKLPRTLLRCPEFSEGSVRFGESAVRLWVGADGETKLGPLVFYWHSSDGTSTEAETALGADVIAEIKSAGGMVAAVETSTNSGIGTGGIWHSGDLDVADRVIACALEKKVGIDTSHIHAIGFSSGALLTSYMSYTRSNYLASVVTYSGGLTSTWWTNSAVQDRSNVVPAMLVHGRIGEDYMVIDFALASGALAKDIRERGGFALDCTHDQGHRIPTGMGAAAFRFMKDHPYKTSPLPYASTLPSVLPAYCQPK